MRDLKASWEQIKSTIEREKLSQDEIEFAAFSIGYTMAESAEKANRNTERKAIFLRGVQQGVNEVRRRLVHVLALNAEAKILKGESENKDQPVGFMSER